MRWLLLGLTVGWRPISCVALDARAREAPSDPERPSTADPFDAPLLEAWSEDPESPSALLGNATYWEAEHLLDAALAAVEQAAEIPDLLMEEVVNGQEMLGTTAPGPSDQQGVTTTDPFKAAVLEEASKPPVTPIVNLAQPENQPWMDSSTHMQAIFDENERMKRVAAQKLKDGAEEMRNSLVMLRKRKEEYLKAREKRREAKTAIRRSHGDEAMKIERDTAKAVEKQAKNLTLAAQQDVEQLAKRVKRLTETLRGARLASAFWQTGTRPEHAVALVQTESWEKRVQELMRLLREVKRSSLESNSSEPKGSLADVEDLPNEASIQELQAVMGWDKLGLTPTDEGSDTIAGRSSEKHGEHHGALEKRSSERDGEHHGALEKRRLKDPDYLKKRRHWRWLRKRRRARQELRQEADDSLESHDSLEADENGLRRLSHRGGHGDNGNGAMGKVGGEERRPAEDVPYTVSLVPASSDDTLVKPVGKKDAMGVAQLLRSRHEKRRRRDNWILAEMAVAGGTPGPPE